MRIGVVGRGLMGSAAARHLAVAGADVTVIGPGEPEEKRSHTGVFGSHYDEGRITRMNATKPFWCEVSRASILRYREIEAASGITFFNEVGALMAGGDDWMARVDSAALSAGVESHAMGPGDLRKRFPYFEFPIGYSGAYEARLAGYISPRNLAKAQSEAAKRAGAKIAIETVQGLDESGQEVRVSTDQATHQFDQVLVAVGGWTDTLLARPPQLDVYKRTVALFEISEDEAKRLAKMPSLVYQLAEDPYLLPPIRYPDGKIYVKLGGDPEDVKLPDTDAVHTWFRSGGDPDVRDRLEELIRALMPSLQIQSITMDACVTSWTQDRLPEIRRLSDRVAVCTGGNGAGAKCSDELGRRGAALVCDKIGETA